MKSFKDAKGREWQVSVTVGSLRRVRDLLHVDLSQLSEGTPPLGVRLTTELFFVAEVLQTLLASQLEKAGLTGDDLLDALEGEALAAGFAALAEELLAFFRNSGRTEQAAFLTAQMNLLTAAAAKVTAKVESLDLEGMLDQRVAEAFSTFATSSPASSASTPST